MKSILLVLTIVLFCSWKPKTRSVIKGFDRKSWIQDSMGCLGLRMKLKLCDTLYCNKEKLIGLKESDLICYLGNPSRSYNAKNKENEKDLEYYIEGGEQCSPGYKFNNKNLDVKTLVLSLQNGVVYEVVVASGGAKCK